MAKNKTIRKRKQTNKSRHQKKRGGSIHSTNLNNFFINKNPLSEFGHMMGII
jgi:hypothetical protein